MYLSRKKLLIWWHKYLMIKAKYHKHCKLGVSKMSVEELFELDSCGF